MHERLVPTHVETVSKNEYENATNKPPFIFAMSLVRIKVFALLYMGIIGLKLAKSR